MGIVSCGCAVAADFVWSSSPRYFHLNTLEIRVSRFILLAHRPIASAIEKI